MRNGSTTNRFTGGEASPPDPSAPKARWRAWARATPVDAPRLSPVVAGHLDEFLAPDAVVLTYLPMPAELAPGPPPRRRTLLVTRTPPTGPLTVHRFDAPRERHRLGFEQPTEGADTWDAPIDVAVVPGLAFGRDGSRLGRGAGHYDRFFAERAIPIRIGVGCDRLLVDRLPADDHDVAMTQVVTESGVLAV